MPKTNSRYLVQDQAHNQNSTHNTTYVGVVRLRHTYMYINFLLYSILNHKHSHIHTTTTNLPQNGRIRRKRAWLNSTRLLVVFGKISTVYDFHCLLFCATQMS